MAVFEGANMALAASADFVLDSVLFPLLRLSTGFLSSFAGSSNCKEIHSPLFKYFNNNGLMSLCNLC